MKEKYLDEERNIRLAEPHVDLSERKERKKELEKQNII